MNLPFRLRFGYAHWCGPFVEVLASEKESLRQGRGTIGLRRAMIVVPRFIARAAPTCTLYRHDPVRMAYVFRPWPAFRVSELQAVAAHKGRRT